MFKHPVSWKRNIGLQYFPEGLAKFIYYTNRHNLNKHPACCLEAYKIYDHVFCNKLLFPFFRCHTCVTTDMVQHQYCNHINAAGDFPIAWQR